jgi:hypothetical protein
MPQLERNRTTPRGPADIPETPVLHPQTHDSHSFFSRSGHLCSYLREAPTIRKTRFIDDRTGCCRQNTGQEKVIAIIAMSDLITYGGWGLTSGSTLAILVSVSDLDLAG